MATIGSKDKFLRYHPAGHVVACPCCKDHGVNVLEDGSRRCVLTGETFDATEEDGDLFLYRSNYEQQILALSMRTGLDWTAIVELTQPEREALAASQDLVDLYHKNLGNSQVTLTIAVVPSETLADSVLKEAVALLASSGWKIAPARAESKCDQRTLWLKAPPTNT